MASISAVVNRSLRAHVTPALRNAGFDEVDARNGLARKGACIWVFQIRAVGSYFSQVTGWPASSVGVHLGIHYTFIPPLPTVETDDEGRLRPKEFECHRRGHLERRLEGAPRKTLSNPAERERKDLWWVEPDGSDADAVARDIAEQMHGTGHPWYEAGTDPAQALSEVEAGHDCLSKFVCARYLALELRRVETERKWRALAEQEALRIGQRPDTGSWFTASGR